MKVDNVLVTGGAGFVGHAVIEYLLANSNFNIISLDRLDCSSDLTRLGEMLLAKPEWKSRLKIIWHDLKSPVNKNAIENIGNVEYILHLAAGSHVNRSIQNPLEFIMDNVVGTCNILEYARRFCDNLKMFLYFSTDEVFGPAEDGEVFHENSRYNACNPYSASKAGGEELCNAYYNTYGLPIVVTHTMNVYGPSQHSEKFIPIIIKKLINNESIEIHTDKDGESPSQRCYLHSQDVGDAIMFLMNNFKSGEKYNIASKYEINGLDLALKISKIMNKKLDFNLKYPEKDRPGNDFRYAVCGKKMLNLGWEQKFSLDEGLERTVAWYLENQWSKK